MSYSSSLHLGLGTIFVVALWLSQKSSQFRIAILTVVALYVVSAVYRIGKMLYQSLRSRRRLTWSELHDRNGSLEIVVKLARPANIRPGQYLFLCFPLSFAIIRIPATSVRCGMDHPRV